MAKTIAQLHTEAQTIRDETVTAANTATRVGGCIDDVVEYIGEIDSSLPRNSSTELPLNLQESDFSVGNINGTDGSISSVSYVRYTTQYIDVSNFVYLSYSTSNSYRVGVAFYDDALTFINKVEWFEGDGTLYLTSPNIRIVIAPPNGITTFDYNTANPSFKLLRGAYQKVASEEYVGDVFDDIYEDVNYIFEQGTIDGSNGNLIVKTDGTRIRTASFIPKRNEVMNLHIELPCSQINIIFYKNGIYAGWIDAALKNLSAGDYVYKIGTATDYDTYKVVCFTSGATISIANSCYVKSKSLASIVYGEPINIEALNVAKIYKYYDALVAAYPNYLSSKVLGYDSSGNYEIKEYVAVLRERYAYLYKNRCYAWKNGGTIIYTESISPRVGDTAYSDQLATSYGSVSSSDCVNSEIIVNSLTFARSAADDIDADILYQTTSSASSVVSGGKTYFREPNFDTSTFVQKNIVTICNEHGPGVNGDPREPSVVMLKLMEALCADTIESPKLDWLKKYAKLVIIPVSNPWAYNEDGDAAVLGNLMGRVNIDGVNINRNYPTHNWVYLSNGESGNYGGDAIETQYNINAVMRHKADIAIDCHCLGPNANNYGKWHYAGAIVSLIKTITKLEMLCTYNLQYSAYSSGDEGHFDTWASDKSIDGGLTEMNQGNGVTLHSDVILAADRYIWFGILDAYEIWGQ